LLKARGVQAFEVPHFERKISLACTRAFDDFERLLQRNRLRYEKTSVQAFNILLDPDRISENGGL